MNIMCNSDGEAWGANCWSSIIWSGFSFHHSEVVPVFVQLRDAEHSWVLCQASVLHTGHKGGQG